MSRRNPFHDPIDPFRDPTNPFRDPTAYGPGGENMASAAGSNAELISLEALAPVNMASPDAGYDHLNKPSAWAEPSNKRSSTAGKAFRKTSIILILVLLLAAVCIAVPVALHFTKLSKSASYSPSGVDAKGFNRELPNMTYFPSMIDKDTPQSAYTSKSVQDNSDYVLVFSDEFNVPGRSFYPGDDPFWEGGNLHYWQTVDIEYYEPGQLTTFNGSLEITLAKFDDISLNYNLSYRSGMMSTWNKFCFTGGRFEASVMLPGVNNALGLWPAVWSMGNLGRVGYGASLDGLWPYTYDACDVGTLANQTLDGKPLAATVNGDSRNGGVLSFLPGQRLSRCTCAGEIHPGPKHSDGTFVGRSAPEIDMLEATVGNKLGVVSQSSQWAPFNEAYDWFNTSANQIIYNASITSPNGYTGGAWQQAISALSVTDQRCYERSINPCYSLYGFEYKPGFDGAYITWMSQGVPTWTMLSPGTAADDRVSISARPVPQEPMYLIANLGLSESFGGIDFDHLTFPTKMRIDYIRVYQPKDAVNIGCDPTDFPTAAYINQYPEAYNNPNLTTWRNDYKQPIPKNKLIDQC